MGAKSGAVCAALTLGALAGGLYETGQAIDEWNKYNRSIDCGSAKLSGQAACKNVLRGPASIDQEHANARVLTGIAVALGIATVVLAIGTAEELGRPEPGKKPSPVNLIVQAIEPKRQQTPKSDSTLKKD